jgi:hypothetical protein
MREQRALSWDKTKHQQHTTRKLSKHITLVCLWGNPARMEKTMNLLTKTDKENLLAAIIRMEHKCTGSMNMEEYASAVRLCQEVQAPQFITEYFAGKFVNGNTEEA